MKNETDTVLIGGCKVLARICSVGGVYSDIGYRRKFGSYYILNLKL